MPSAPAAPDPTLPVGDPALPADPTLPIGDPALPAPGLVVIAPANPTTPPLELALDRPLAGAVTVPFPVAVGASDSGAPEDYEVVSEPVAIEQPADPYARKLGSGYALMPEPSTDRPGDAPQPPSPPGAAPPAVPAPGTAETTTPSGQGDPGPLPGGTGLPAPNALPPAPGSGSGNMNSANGPSGAVAWIPSLYLVIPTAGDDPIRGPLQHQHSAVSADPGSSPD
ncbi:hypothetical protein [Arthrobacter sp. CG_A4]|uniref:hypothetical protein n=1 Tax=Arthrobacter sp. CG_A4 TaxID=3071706 RepID=UPI002E056095|nr:hypothetical protein [Arthrobacter sp. CG_A4]